VSIVIGSGVRAVVPAYFHPTVHPDAWERLARSASTVRLVVLNVANGPGGGPDPVFLEPVARLREAGVDVAGYVDTNYGRRQADDALVDLERYVDWYELGSVVFDRVSSTEAHVDHYAALAQWARLFGAQMVAFNHGTHPVKAYADHADLLGTFEGTWGAYVDAKVPGWVRSLPAEQFYHLVYSVPPARVGDAYALAARRHAGGAYVTDHGGTNPWEYLPAASLDHLTA
jgi:Spherulation-specific family 4